MKATTPRTNKRQARAERRRDRLRLQMDALSATTHSNSKRPSYHQIIAGVKNNRTPNLGGRVLWNSARKGTFVGNTEDLRRTKRKRRLW